MISDTVRNRESGYLGTGSNHVSPDRMLQTVPLGCRQNGLKADRHRQQKIQPGLGRNRIVLVHEGIPVLGRLDREA